MIPAMVAEYLGVPHATALTSVDIADDVIRGARAADDGTERVAAALPVVISITEALPDARFPNFKGIMAAKKKPFETLSLADLELELDTESPWSIVAAISEKPPREAGVKIVDQGDAGEQLAEFLAHHRLI